jgi:S1-C subfamily serine protease
MKQLSWSVRSLVVLSALIGAVSFAGSKPEEPVAAAGFDAGVLVVRVEPNSPAATAGIVRGDIILAVDGVDVAAGPDLQRAIAAKQPGDKVKLAVRHGDAKRTLAVTLGEADGRTFLGVYFEPPALGQSPMGPGPQPPSARPAPRTPPIPSVAARAGARLVTVAEGSPAAQAGLKEGDVITAIDGTALERNNDLAQAIGAHKPGDSVKLEVFAPGQEAPREATVTLAADPKDPARAWLGVAYRMAFRAEGTTPWAGRMPVALGVRITAVTDGSPAAAAGLAKGDLLTTIDGLSVLTAREAAAAISGHKPGDTVKVGVARASDEKETEIDVTLGEDPQKKGKAFLGVQLGGPWMVPGWPEGRGWNGRPPAGPGGPGASAPGDA